MKKTCSALLTLLAVVLATSVTVRADTWGEPINTPDRFVVLSSFNNQAVFDKETGLVWEQSPALLFQGWSGARNDCNTKAVGNRRGWRLPSIQELASVIDPTATSGVKIPAGSPFSSVLDSIYWSANTLQVDSTIAWTVHFDTGTVEVNHKDFGGFAWCVRGGPGTEPQ